MLNKLKSQKGITGIDLTISLIVIMLFVSIIATLSVKVSSSLASKRRIDIATNCMTEIIEKLDSMSYTDVELIQDFEKVIGPEETYQEEEGKIYELRKAVQTILSQKDENDEYKYSILQQEVEQGVELKVETYVPNDYTEENPPDLVKKVTVKITYLLNNKPEEIEVTRLKTRYNTILMNDE